VTNTVRLPFFLLLPSVPFFLDSMQYFVFHMIPPSDVFHASPAILVIYESNSVAQNLSREAASRNAGNSVISSFYYV
jgi:hypothetical protein